MSVVALLLAIAGLQPEAVHTDPPIEMNAHLARIDPISPSCLRRFMRLKVPDLSLGVAIEVDVSGKVAAATLESRSPQADLDACILDWVKTAQFTPDSPKQGTYVASLINARLSPPSQKYEQPPADGSAEIRNWSRLALCKVTGLSGPPQKSACKATVLLIDERRTGFLSGQNKVAAGYRKLTLTCDVHDYSVPGTFVPTSFSQTRVFAVEDGANYELRPRWQEDTCVVDVVNIETEQVLQE